MICLKNQYPNLFTIIFSTLFIVGLYSCNDELISSDPKYRLEFSTDTLTFDTVLTTLGSATSKIVLYNRNKVGLNISSIKIMSGSASVFKINVDGSKSATNEFRNIEIRPNDSLYIFVAVTINPGSANSPIFIENAFKDARAADGAAKLYYNDYNIEWQTPKLNFLIAMVNDFKTRSIPIDGIGFQMHVGLTFPSITSIRSALQAATNTGLLVKITELDVAVNGNNTLTSLDSTTSASQKQRYHDIVKAYLDIVPPAQRGGITVWGLTDGESWINQPGHPDWPLMYNNDYTTKPAYDGVVQALQGL